MKISAIAGYKPNTTRFNDNKYLSSTRNSQSFGVEEQDSNKLERNKMLYLLAFLATMGIAGFYGLKKGWFARGRSKASKEPVEIKTNIGSGVISTVEEGLQRIRENSQNLLDKDFLLDFGRKAYAGYEQVLGGAEQFWKALNEANVWLPEGNKSGLVRQMFHLGEHSNYENGNRLSIYKTSEGVHRNAWGIIEKQIAEVFA